MTAGRAAGLAMPVAGLMIAHQVAAKAVRDATFLDAWPASRLPAAVIASALLAVALVPLYSRLLEHYGPRLVASGGFLISAAGHALEWRYLDLGPWVAVVVYLHVGGLTGLLLSGFWSLASELFDPKTARAKYGRIAAAGTVGGLLGGVIAARIGDLYTTGDALLFLAGIHICCAAGVLAFGRAADIHATVRVAPAASTDGGTAAPSSSIAPQLRTLALIVVLGSAAATVFDYLLKRDAVAAVGTGPPLLQFFATFYVVVQVATFAAQFGVNAFVRRFGLGRAVSALPAGVASLGALNLLYPTLPLVVAARGTEYVLRGSLFRSAYELVFVPMAPAEKRRAKTFLDVTCDRAGDVIGAVIVQMFLFTSALYFRSELVAVIIALSATSLWIGRRFDQLYLDVVERRLTSLRDETPVVVQSETGWTVLELPAASTRSRGLTMPPRAPIEQDRVLARLAELRCGDRDRVARALATLDSPDPFDVAAMIQLLAWNDVVPAARVALTRAAASHIGALTDALLDVNTDFAIRRRVPRILATVASPRALAALVAGLDDARFEVRYQCSAGLRRLLAQHPEFHVDRGAVLTIVERELNAAPSVWQAHRLIDKVEEEDEVIGAADEHRNVEHVYSLLSAVLPAGPLRVAFEGMQTDDAALRGVAAEYLESALPRPIWTRLAALLELRPTPSSGDAPGRSGPPPPATPR